MNTRLYCVIIYEFNIHKQMKQYNNENARFVGLNFLEDCIFQLQMLIEKKTLSQFGTLTELEDVFVEIYSNIFD